MPWILAWTLLNVDLLFAGKFGTAASTGVVMPPKPQMIAKQDWRYVSGGGRVMRNAHEPSTEITSLAFASNGHSLASRGADETLKVFLTVCVSFCFYLSVWLTSRVSVGINLILQVQAMTMISFNMWKHMLWDWAVTLRASQLLYAKMHNVSCCSCGGTVGVRHHDKQGQYDDVADEAVSDNIVWLC